jgi:predicted membrane protein
MAESGCNRARVRAEAGRFARACLAKRGESQIFRSVAVFIAFAAIMPAVFMIVAVMIAIVISLMIAAAGSRDYARRRKGNQPQKDSASNKGLYICHGCSNG